MHLPAGPGVGRIAPAAAEGATGEAHEGAGPAAAAALALDAAEDLVRLGAGLDVLVVDADARRIVEANPAAGRLLDKPASKLVRVSGTSVLKVLFEGRGK